jgi:hypothetical protein
MKKAILSISVFLLANVLFSQESKTTLAPAEQSFVVGKYTVKYVVENRKATRLPRLDIMSQEHGTIVIDVTIDKYGNVTNASPNAELSDTKSTYLTTKAKQAAETTHFDTTPTTPLKTKGTMSFTF